MDELLDVQRRMDQAAYPERWERLQEELEKRRAGGEPAPRPAPLLGLGPYVAMHLVLCPVIFGTGACFVDRGGGEGAGCLLLAGIPLIAALSLISLGTHSTYRTARRPDRFLWISIVMIALGAPILASVAVAVLEAVKELFF